MDNFEKYKTLNIRQALALNQLISLSIDGTPILSYMNSQPANMILKDYETLNCQTFKWDEIDIPAIEKRASFIKQFNIDIPEERFSLLNTEPFEKLISLKFLDMVTENPNLSFGTPLYNNSLNYYTYLLKYFIIFYLKKDLLFLDKIDAEDIETYTPIGRYYIRCNNRQNSKLRAKYFNEEFNLIKFAIKMVEKFVIGATWRWIGGNHMAHVYCIEICKIVIECGIASLEECEEIKHALYLKIQVYRYTFYYYFFYKNFLKKKL